ncbi:MAG: DEAD/DEAH box helicase [Planctomycetota bacterium]
MSVSLLDLHRAARARRTPAPVPLGLDAFRARVLVALSPRTRTPNARAELRRLADLAERHAGLRARSNQMAAVRAMLRGSIVELDTGEGKTLVGALLAARWAQRGEPVHVVTANDYLAQRDADRFASFFAAAGTSVASIVSASSRAERAHAYSAGVVYSTSKELAADFLRDSLDAMKGRSAASMLYEGERTRMPLQRGLGVAIVDEADSVLIDEAGTPLILSETPVRAAATGEAKRAHEVAASLVVREHYDAIEQTRDVKLNARGRERLARTASGVRGVWSVPRRREELVTTALVVRIFFLRDVHYVNRDGRILIVDEFTGRILPDRTWRRGLQQAVEIKEGLEPSTPTATSARTSFQQFFRRYRHLCGMTGTAREARGEFASVYACRTERIEPYRTSQRVRLPTLVSADGDSRDRAVAEEVERVRERGRPVLVGTRSVHASECLSEELDARGIRHLVLNAVRHEREAEIIRSAGQPGAVTVATNMAGRGTDIELGDGVAESGGLHVIAAEPNQSARIDRQLFGRCGRQGDPGTCRLHVSPDDDLFRRFPPRFPLGSLAVRDCQRRAQASAVRQRASLAHADDALEDSLWFAAM